MPRNEAQADFKPEAGDESAHESTVSATLFEVEIGPGQYRDREYYASRDAVHARAPIGILRGLRDVIARADGRTVVVSIALK